jgi:hypothetical protein
LVINPLKVWQISDICGWVGGLINQNYVHEEIKSRLNSGDACYHSVQNLLSSRLLSKNIKITKCTNTILPFALYGCDTWSLSLREEHWLRMFYNRVQRNVFGPKRDEKEDEGYCTVRGFMICTPHQILCG